MVNVDAETLRTLDALAYSARMSRSAVAADALQSLVPALGPVVEFIAQSRTAPAEAMRRLAAHAETIAEMTERVVGEIRREAARTPPPSNTGG
jgi:predicted transcriptional regulator